MSIILVLIPLGLVLVAAAVAAFFWAVGNGQFDDLDSPAWRILTRDDTRPEQRQQPSPDDDTNDSEPR